MFFLTFILQLNEERTKVKRLSPVAQPTDVDDRTVYVVSCSDSVFNYTFCVCVNKQLIVYGLHSCLFESRELLYFFTLTLHLFTR